MKMKEKREKTLAGGERWSEKGEEGGPADRAEGKRARNVEKKAKAE